MAANPDGAAATARMTRAQGARLQWPAPWLQFVVGALAALVVVASALHQVRSYGSGSDLTYFLARSRDLLAGRDPYAAAAASAFDPHTGAYVDIFYYNPLVYYLLAPLTALSFTVAQTLWALLNAAFLIAGVSAFARLARPEVPPVAGPVLAAVLSLTFMSRFELFYGNADIVLLCCLALSLLAARRGHATLAGVLLGLGALAYMQAIIFVLYYLWKREYRAAGVAAGVFVAGMAGGFLVAGGTAFGNFVTVTQLFFGNWSAIWINQSLYGVLLRLFQPTPYASGPIVALAWLPALGWLLWAAVVITPTARLLPRRPLAEATNATAGLDAALAVGAMLLCFPLLEANTLVASSLLLVALALHVTRDLRSRRNLLIGAAAVVLYGIECVSLLHFYFSLLGSQRGLHGARLFIASAGSVPFLYLTAAEFCLVYAALVLNRRANATTGSRRPAEQTVPSAAHVI